MLVWLLVVWIIFNLFTCVLAVPQGRIYQRCLKMSSPSVSMPSDKTGMIKYSSTRLMNPGKWWPRIIKRCWWTLLDQPWFKSPDLALTYFSRGISKVVSMSESVIKMPTNQELRYRLTIILRIMMIFTTFNIPCINMRIYLKSPTWNNLRGVAKVITINCGYSISVGSNAE